MCLGSTSMPYLLIKSCASIGCSRCTLSGGVDVIVLVSTNIPFSSFCFLSLQAALLLYLAVIFQSAIIINFEVNKLVNTTQN